MTKEEWIKKVSKIDQTFEDEFRAKYNSPELMWEHIISKLVCPQCALADVVVSPERAELPPDTICVLCEGICEPSPTEKGWTHLRYQQGAHHDCLITMGKKTEHMIKQGGN